MMGKIHPAYTRPHNRCENPSECPCECDGCFKARKKIDDLRKIQDNGKLLNEKFGKLTVIALDKSLHKRKDKRLRWWVCKCECGKECSIAEFLIIRGRKLHCGCSSPSRIIKKDPPSFIAKALFNSYKGGAKARGFAFELEFEEFKDLVLQPCFYCGGSRIKYIDDIGVKISGLDRIDSSVGYIQTNILPCCTICNMAKGRKSVTEFLEWIQRLTRHWDSMGGIR